jgi:dihydroflavonol-4-reductase
VGRFVTATAADGRLVFLTGATGFIGGRLARALNDRGYRIRCLVRSPERAAALAAMGAELIVGDITDETALAKAAAGAQLAYHLAAIYEIGRIDVGAMERTNVEGTRRFLSAVQAAGVPRVVHVSSTAALGPVRADVTADDGAYGGPHPSVYHRTKAESHALAHEAQQRGEPVIVACPGFVYGPGDEGPSLDFISDVLRHRVPGLSTRPTYFTYVHIDDVVDGLVAAGERGAAGATYVLGGESSSVNDFAKRVASIAETWLSPLRFPPPLVTLTGVLMDGISRLTGWRLPINRELAVVGGSGSREDHPHERAARELGYSPRPLAAGLPDTIRDVQERLSR